MVMTFPIPDELSDSRSGVGNLLLSTKEPDVPMVCCGLFVTIHLICNIVQNHEDIRFFLLALVGGDVSMLGLRTFQGKVSLCVCGDDDDDEGMIVVGT